MKKITYDIEISPAGAEQWTKKMTDIASHTDAVRALRAHGLLARLAGSTDHFRLVKNVNDPTRIPANS